jgi:hypothetical protein
VPDESKEPTPPRSATTTSGRRRRFALPREHHGTDQADRAAEHIEAFLDGPTRERRTRRAGRPADVLRPRTPVPLETRTDWERAARHEDARVARYGRPASVLVVDIAAGRDGVDDADVGRVGLVVRRLARETDRVARIGPTRLHVLLPETDGHEAAALAARIERACRPSKSTSPDATVRVAVASASDGATLADALRLAQRRLEA